MTDLEDTLFFQLTSILDTAQVTVEREYRFHPTRMWRADFALPEYKILIECNGGTFAHMGHSTGSGISRDYKKANEAAILGWCYLQFDRASIESGEAVNTIIRAMGRAR